MERAPERDEHRTKGRDDPGFYQQAQQQQPLAPLQESAAPHLLPEQVVLPNSLQQLPSAPLPSVPQQQPSGAATAPPPAPLLNVSSQAPISQELGPRKKPQGSKVGQTPEELQAYYDKLANQRTFARANPGKGAWFWEHLEPQLVRGHDGTPLAVKLHCRCCSLVLGASNPSRTAAEHLRGGACPNFQKQGMPEPVRKKRVRVSMPLDSGGPHPLLGPPDSHHHHDLMIIDPGRLRAPVPQLPSNMASTGAPYTYVSNVFTEIQPPAKGILTHTIRHDQQLRLMLLGFAPGEEMSIPMYAAPYKASATLTFLSGEADVFLGSETIKVYQGGMVHITADVSHTVRALTPVMLMASITRY